MNLPPQSPSRLPVATPPRIQDALAHAVDAWIAELGIRLQSLVLFGSVARGTATPESDIDLLAVVGGLPRSLRDRRQLLLATWMEVRRSRGLEPVEWSLVVKTPEEAAAHSPLYLDIVEDGILLFDRDGFFARVLAAMRSRMRELGSRRVFLADGSWYWDLKPDYRAGEIVEL